MSGGAPGFSILDLAPDDEEAIGQAAKILVEGFRDDWPEAWTMKEEALEEMREALGEDRICRVAVGEDGTILGWIGAIPGYEGKVWELHPLVVRSDVQRMGIGRAARLGPGGPRQRTRRPDALARLGRYDEHDHPVRQGSLP